MSRTKLYVEFPIAKSLKEAVAWMEAGNECWQEDSNDWPECGGFDDIDCLEENFVDGLDETDNVHLVTKVPEKSPLFKVNDEVVALEDLMYCCGQDEDDEIPKGQVNFIERIRLDQNGQQELFFHDHADRYGPWKASRFVLNVCGDNL